MQGQLEPLIGALKDKSENVRLETTKTLDKLRWKPGNDTEKVHYLIAKKEWHELANVGRPAIEPLIQALDKSSSVRQDAAGTLRKIGELAVEPLIQVLKDENKNVRFRLEASEILGKIGDARAVKPLIQSLTDEDEDIRRKVKNALGVIRNSLGTEHNDVRLQIEDAITQTRKEAEAFFYGVAPEKLDNVQNILFAEVKSSSNGECRFATTVLERSPYFEYNRG